MTIYVVCVNPASGTYLAVATENHKIRAIAESYDSAVGALVRNTPDIHVDAVVNLDEAA